MSKTDPATAKPEWASRTIWVNLIAIVASLGGVFHLDLGLTPERQAQIVLVVMGGVNVILRYDTKAPITSILAGLAALGKGRDKVNSAPIAMAIALGLAVLFLTGCASREAETPTQRVFALQADYNALLALAVAYESQPRCGPGERLGCSDADVVAEIRRADNHAFDAIRTAQNLVRSPNARDSPVQLALAGAIEAVGLVRRILDREGIR